MNEKILVGYPTFDTAQRSVASIGYINTLVSSQAVSVSDLCDNLPQFFVMNDINGEPVLCTFMEEGKPIQIVDDMSTGHMPESFVAVFGVKNELVGGRPPVHR